MVPKLLPLVPKHQTYVEVFGGSAALFFAKSVSPLEVINDLNSGLVNFYRVLRDPAKFQKFEYLANLTPFSREEFNFCRATWQTCQDDVEKAHRWFVLIRHSYGAMGHSFGNSIADGKNGMATSVRSYLSAVARLSEVHQRLSGAQIENLDFRELIKKYDRLGTFFYLDPPYVHSTRSGNRYYAHEMTDRDHEETVSLLLAAQGRSMVSGYANPIYRPLEQAGWKRLDFRTVCPAAARKKKSSGDEKNGARIESVWVRYC